MPRSPNVVFLMTDHTRAEALRSAQCLTPNLDALAGQGVRFERACTTNAICSPARASLMTGTYASTHGVWDCTHTQRREWVDTRGNLRHWAQQLQQAGYDNAYFGKWHVEQSNRLEDFGWPTYDLKCAKYRVTAADKPLVVARTPGYNDAIVAGVDSSKEIAHHPAFDKGLEFIRSRAGGGKPFCCFISTAEPHDPYVPPRQFFDMYDPKALALSPTLHDDLADKPEVTRRMASLWRSFTDDDWRMIVAAYFASITFLDHEIGRVVEALRQAGIYDETILVFSADHGDMLGSHGLLAKGITPYEEVYNIPLIVRVPGLAAAQNRTHRVSTVNIGQTLRDFCGAPGIATCQGRSLRPVLQGQADAADWQDAYAEFYGQRFVYTQRILWHGDWKYVFSPGGIDELYDLAKDPNERQNLAARADCRDRLLDMTCRMWRKMEAIGDESLLNTHYKTLRTAPIGPLAR